MCSICVTELTNSFINSVDPVTIVMRLFLICREGVGVNSICCSSCKKWIHKRCSDVVDSLEKIGNFMCRNCTAGGVKVIDEVKQFVLGNNDKDEFQQKVSI